MRLSLRRPRSFHRYEPSETQTDVSVVAKGWCSGNIWWQAEELISPYYRSPSPFSEQRVHLIGPCLQ
jgi:hypothetical protein